MAPRLPGREVRSGSCWDDGPDQCVGCSYCDDARHTPAGEPALYPDEQKTRDADLAQKRLNIDAAMRTLARQQAADLAAARAGYAATARRY